MLNNNLHYIDTLEALEAWVAHAMCAPCVAVDTESDSLHHYREKVCLIQMSAAGVDAIIDPLVLPHVKPLVTLFENATVTKIFHDAGYDLICLLRDFNMHVVHIFDTMWASRLIGYRQFGLAAMLREHFDFEADKRLQRSDWTKRPLSYEQRLYAHYDTHFLPDLMHILTAKLQELGRLAWAQEDFARMPAIAQRFVQNKTTQHQDGFWRISGVAAMSQDIKGRLRALYQARERIAQRLDKPAFKVFSDHVLIDLASDPPISMRHMCIRKGFGHIAAYRFGKEMWGALQHATPVLEDPPKGSGKRRRCGRLPDAQAKERYEALRKLRSIQAAQLDIEPEVALSNAILEDLARAPPSTIEMLRTREELAGWRGDMFATHILSLL